MAPPLSEGMVENDGARQATVENMAYDVVNFLQWATEPELGHRYKAPIHRYNRYTWI